MKISPNHNYDYDVAVVGGGPAGAKAAGVLGRGGAKVVLIEGRELGGTCVNRGCIPAKTMLYMAQQYRRLKKMDRYGIDINFEHVEINYPAMLARRQGIIERQRQHIVDDLEMYGVEVIKAFAELTEPNLLELSNGQKITADQIVLATGGRARRFPGFLEDDSRYLTSDNIFALDKLPKSITIVGGGPVGTEFASYYRAFDVEVHIVDRGKTFFGYYDHRLGRCLAEEFSRQGIDVHNSATVDEIDTSGELLKIHLTDGKTIESEYVLSAIGVEVINEYIKIDLEQGQSGRLVVDDTYQTNYSHIYAVGDLIGRAGTAYGAEREAKNVAYQLLGWDTDKVPVNYPAITDVVFTYPEVGTCGMSQQQLIEAGIPYECRKMEYKDNAKAQIKSEEAGAIWMYSDPETQKILGVHIIGAQATEMIHAIPILLLNEMTITEYLKAVWGHPVLAELLKETMLNPKECDLPQK